jgi:hypothetical protein
MATKVKLIADNAVSISNLNVSDGSNGQALVTNGSGTLSFSDVTPDQTLTIVGRSSNLGVNLTSATLTIVGRSGNISVGV